MGIQLTLLFLTLHIISAGVWVSQFVAEWALERFAERVKGKPGEVALVMAQGSVASLMGTVGGMGILVTGLLLTFQFHYGILGIGGVYTPTWLVIKQIIFIVAMGIIGAVVTRSARQAMPALIQALSSGQPVPAEAKPVFDRAMLASRLVNLLVLINIFVGIYGVNGGVLP